MRVYSLDKEPGASISAACLEPFPSFPDNYCFTKSEGSPEVNVIHTGKR
jgi:hypothetical protein